MSSLSSLPQSPGAQITIRLFEIEDLWADDNTGPEFLQELNQLHAKVTSGADRHLARCLIELIEGHPRTADGETQRLLAKRSNRRWDKKIIHDAGVPACLNVEDCKRLAASRKTS